MTKCRDCGQPIQFLDGDKRPYDLTPRIHYANPIHKAWAKENSPAKKNGAKPKKAKPGHTKTVARGAVAEAAKLLKDMRYTEGEAADMLKDIPEAEPEAMVLAALTKMGAGKGDE